MRVLGLETEMSAAFLIPIAAVSTGVVVIVVAIAVVLVVLFVTLSMRGRQRRVGKRRDDLAEAHERAARAERDREIAQEQAHQQGDPDR
jgi:predicted Holliday junction resolvase-like endonuclease